MRAHMQDRRSGFTLLELLVVIFIILVVSAVALPTILPALNHRQVSEAARILQGVLIGARDKAIHDGTPSGIRLLPDPLWNGVNPTTGQLDPAYPLAFNRAIPIGPAPDYREGAVNVFPPSNPAYAYSAAVRTVTTPQGAAWTGCPCLVVEQAVVGANSAPNLPTSWFWNVRLGDTVQINNSGPWYTVVGPMAQVNPEMFVNIDPPGTSAFGTPLPTLNGGLPCEFLLLTNDQDDNGNGWADEGFDGVDNDGDGNIDEHSPGTTAQINGATVTLDEWEQEAWLGSAAAGLTNAPYTLARRPAPSTNAREIALPTSMVIDATTWGNAHPERSRLPIESSTGAVDVMVNPDGTAYFASMYGVPTRYGLGSAFYHFWLAERQDVAPIPLQVDASGNPVQPPIMVPIETVGGSPHYLPIEQPSGVDATYAGPGRPVLKGEYAVLTLFARNGQVAVNVHPPFDDPLNPFNGSSYDPSFPFRQAQQGVVSGP